MAWWSLQRKRTCKTRVSLTQSLWNPRVEQLSSQRCLSVTAVPLLLALQLQPTSLKSFSDLSMEKEMSECTWRVTELKSVCEIYCKKEYRLEGIIVMCHIMGWTFSRQQMERRMRGATKWDKKKEEWQLWNKISSLPCTWLAETQHCFTFAELVANSYIYLLK